MQISFTKSAAKQLRNAPRKVAQSIVDALSDIAKDGLYATARDVKPLVGRDGYRLRVGTRCVLFTANGAVILVFKVGPRGSIYR